MRSICVPLPMSVTGQRRLRFGITLWIALLGVLAFGQPVVEVEQGGVGRWVSPDCDSCGMNGRAFFPVDGVCYFPVDFTKKPGVYEIARWSQGQMETAWLRVTAKEFPSEDIQFDDTSFVQLSKEDLNRHHGEQAQIKPLFRGKAGPPLFSLALAKPTEPLPGGDNFGANRTFNGEPKSRHTGADYLTPLGTAINAVAKGRVVLTGEHFFAGKSVYVDHGNGLVSMVFHLNEISVTTGQMVEQGETLGKVGSTGRSTGPHLHLGFRWHGQKIDPNALLDDPATLPTVAPSNPQ